MPEMVHDRIGTVATTLERTVVVIRFGKQIKKNYHIISFPG